MAKTNAERQRSYRLRRTGKGGRHERLSCYVSISTKRNLERLAAHFRLTMTDTLERIVSEHTAALLARLDEHERELFFEELPLI